MRKATSNAADSPHASRHAPRAKDSGFANELREPALRKEQVWWIVSLLWGKSCTSKQPPRLSSVSAAG